MPGEGRTATSALMRGVLAVIIVCVSACAGISTPGGGGSRVAYGRDAQEAYENALGAFRRDNCIDAEPAFRRVRREYPYSRFAALAELRVADCKFKQTQYAEAISAYRQFIRFRPSHTQVEYARFRVAECHYEQIPSAWLLSPPTHERDPSATQDALRQMRRFLLDFPESDRLEDARRIIGECLNFLANHEFYAAKFYLRRDAYPAVVNRLQTLLRTYEGAEIESEALLMLGETFEEMDDASRARRAYEELLERFPQSDEAGSARSAMAGLPEA